MSETPFFSVIVPCFNVGPYFDSTLQSLCNQTFKLFEVFFIDDGSSVEKADELVNKVNKTGLRARVLRLDKNSGPSAARNKGIVEAQGDYLCFLDSDDCWAVNKLEVIKQNIEKYNPALVGHLMEGDKLDVGGLAEPFFYTQLQFIIRNRATTSSLVIKKDVMQLFDEEMRFCEDYDLILALMEEHQFLMIPTNLGKLGRPVLSAGGQSSNSFKMRVGEMQAYFNFASRRFYRVIFVPLLFLYSCFKHSLRWLKKFSF